jgi:NADPH:quinone reductase-like Zn-dependent oxidoreductase
MKALWLDRIGAALELRELPAPAARRNAVVVEVLAVRVPAYTRRVFDGSLPYDLPVPCIPGPSCIGRIVETGPDVFHLAPGEVVLCNALLSSGEAEGGDDILIGWTGNGTERGRRMQRMWRHGSFAERALYPAGCIIPLPGAEAFDTARLPFVASLAIADGAWQRGGLAAGQTAMVLGASGQLGSAAVLLALARGAARVVAAGRDAGRLARLAALSPRVAVCTLAGDGADAERLRAAAGGGAELLLDLLADTPGASPTLDGLRALRRGGTAVLAGGVKAPLGLPYAELMRRGLTLRGSFMFDAAMARATWALVRAGVLDLGPVVATAFGLKQMEAAMELAATQGGFEMTVLLPGGA